MEELVLVARGRFASNHELDCIRNSCDVLSLKDEPFNPFDKPETKNLTQDKRPNDMRLFKSNIFWLYSIVCFFCLSWFLSFWFSLVLDFQMLTKAISLLVVIAQSPSDHSTRCLGMFPEEYLNINQYVLHNLVKN